MAAMINLKARERDEFLKALDEARRAALADDGEPVGARKPQAASYGSAEFLHTVDRMAGKIRSYVSTGLLSRLYAYPQFAPATPIRDTICPLGRVR